MQDALARLAAYWTAQGCLTVQPMNTEVGAGTLNSATLLRVLGPEPWRVGYVEPSVRPDDSRYGENPNRLQTHTQFQVILKPDPGNPQELYLGSLEALGIDTCAHDVRFVEDNWASPAMGAWGLGWEVWLDGLEITQFTYFQQSGGLNLDPVSVELTYGMERIIMALQKVTHFKDIEYAPGISYGEVFGQSEFEMSRYYLDNADVETQRQLLELFAAEAQRLIDARLPVPAHYYVLKCSHAFNVLDSRGVISTAERASEFARMRRMAGQVSALWEQIRHDLGHPLGVTPALAPAAPAEMAPEPGTGPRTAVFEIGTEELPPFEARAAVQQLDRELTQRLNATRLAHGAITVLATPRRLIALIAEVAAQEPDAVRTVKGPKVSAAFTADGTPTPAAAGFARSQGVGAEQLEQQEFGGVPHLVAQKYEKGRRAEEVLAGVLAGAALALRPAKNMRWNDPELSYSRPIRWLLALWGDRIIPVTMSTLAAGRQTRLHRTSAQPVVDVADAESYLEVLADGGIVADQAQRRQLIEEAALRLSGDAELMAAQSGTLRQIGGGTVDLAGEAALLDQITYLVEQPAALLGQFEERYLELPEQVLTAVMRKHQRYLPVRDPDGSLLPFFVVVANRSIDTGIDPDQVRAGNEAVLRARYEDAAFFYRADRQVPLADLRARLGRLTFTDQLGSMAERASRIAELAGQLALAVGLTGDAAQDAARAAELVKFDLGSQLVTEMTSLAGTMARDYALNAGERPGVAQAVYEAELPRASGGELPRSIPGMLLSMADRFDLLAGLAATVGLPTGSSDPFALRRAALGLLAVHRSQPEMAAVSLAEGLAAAAKLQPVEVSAEILQAASDFLSKRLEQVLVDEGFAVDQVRAVLKHADRPYAAVRTLKELGPLLKDQQFRRLAEVLQRARRIVPAGTAPGYDPSVLSEPAELALHQRLSEVAPDLSGAGDLNSFVSMAAALIDPVNTFFEDVFVMADDPDLRRARLGLAATVAELGDGVLQWDQLRL